MPLSVNADRARAAAQLLYLAFNTSGIHGRNDMPEDVLPEGTERGSLEHLLFITLTVSIDYQRDATVLWANSRKTFADPETRYLYDPRAIHEAPAEKVVSDMQKYRLSKKPRKDADIWRTVGITFHKKWGNDPTEFLADCGWDSPEVLKRLKNDSHLDGHRAARDFPYLRGDKIGPLWIRMLRDNAGITELKNLDKIPIPVDIHVARASLAVGAVRGRYVGGMEILFEQIRRAWSEGVTGLGVGHRPMMALDVDEPLWHLSKYGCTHRDKHTGRCPMASCEALEFCVPGCIRVGGQTGQVEIDT